MISTARLTKQLDDLSKITSPGQGITRLAFSDSDWQGRQYIINLMQTAGLSIRIDAFGNVIGHYAGQDENLPAIMFGSHGDSVPNGGNYDGIVGILAAIETIRSMKEDNFIPEHPLEVVLFMCEESSRFSAATLGSRAMRGELSLDDLNMLHDKEGNTLFNVLKTRQLNPENIANATYTKPLKAFLEVHIEQGKVLEHAHDKIGVVTGIAAPTRFICHLHGKADHSGATPMHLRHDGLCAAAEIILAVEEQAREYKEAPVVGTVGIAEVQPGVMNVIPGEVHIGFDIRSISSKAKKFVADQIHYTIEDVAARRGITFDIEEISNETPAVMNTQLVRLLSDICEHNHIKYQQMPSGAGHDSMHWANYAPTGMIFIPCKDGISHNPAETAAIEDIVTGTTILEKAVRKLASSIE